MKKFQKIVLCMGIGFIFAGGLFFAIDVPQANATTPDEVRVAQIAALEKARAELRVQIEELMAQISELQEQLNQKVWCHDFDKNLKYGDVCQGSGDDCEVLQLQNALNKEGIQGAYKDNANASGGIAIFAEYTASAVVGFQQKYKEDILVPWGLEYGTGFVGKTTREKLNELYGCGITPNITCRDLWWYDNEHQYCQQKQFCGTYMYLGLHTFVTQQECETALGQVQPSITVLSPNGGEQWVVEETYTIRWNSVRVEKADIELLLFDSEYNVIGDYIGGAYGEIVSNGTIENKGYYNWKIPESILDNAITNPRYFKIFIRQFEMSASDTSDDYFSIVAAEPTTCHTSDLWAWNYCSPSCKCNEGEGDCDADADCADGLYCHKNVGTQYGQSAKMDVCEVKQQAICSDTDGGKDYYKKGIVTLSDGVKLTDYCMTGAYEGDVEEYYCTLDGHGMTNYTCPNGCLDGACVQETGLKDLGVTCSTKSECSSGFCVDGVCCNNACAGRDCQTCGALSSQGIGHCGYVTDSSADPRNDCSQGSTVSDGCKSDNCSGKNWSCGVIEHGNDGGCPSCHTCDGSNTICRMYIINTQDTKGSKTCESCKQCVNGNCVNIANGQDLFGECSETGCGTGNCNGNGECGWLTSGEGNCVKCKTCLGATSTSCRYFSKGEKDDEGSERCDQAHYRCDGMGKCSAPYDLAQTDCSDLCSNDCSEYCPFWCISQPMCRECWGSSMRVYSNNSCSGTGTAVYSGSCNQKGGNCKCFYERYQYE